MNNFYASVECLHNPAIRDKPVVVGGDPEARHGIVLAKNYIAKKTGIVTGEVLWQARQKCPGLVVVPPDFTKYLKFARMAREMYGDYTDQIEPFGLDEAAGKNDRRHPQEVRAFQHTEGRDAGGQAPDGTESKGGACDISYFILQMIFSIQAL